MCSVPSPPRCQLCAPGLLTQSVPGFGTSSSPSQEVSPTNRGHPRLPRALETQIMLRCKNLL